MVTKNKSDDDDLSVSNEDTVMDLARANTSNGVMESLLAGRALHRNRVTVKDELIRSDVLHKQFNDKVKWLQDGYKDQGGSAGDSQIRSFIDSIREIQKKSFRNIVVKNGKPVEEDDEYLRQWEYDMNEAAETFSKLKPAKGATELVVPGKEPSIVVSNKPKKSVTTRAYGATGWKVATKSGVGDVEYEEVDKKKKKKKKGKPSF